MKPQYLSRFAVAPMMNWTDRHCRYFYRLLSKNALLYTEMISTQAILNGDKKYLLDYSAVEHPLALQLGGNNPVAMAKCVKIAEKWGYDEININVGCPSDRVQSGHFGACLMKTPKVVAECVDSMCQATELPITVKMRLGVDDNDSFDELSYFVQTVRNRGCKTFIIHARKAWLSGLSPSQNRNIPPLNYNWVYRIKHDFPEVNIVINGGITSILQAQSHLKKVDGVMLGRAAYHQPYLLSDVDKMLNPNNSDSRNRAEVLLDFIDYIKIQNQQGVPIRAMSRHILGLGHGMKNAKKFRRLLSGETVELSHLYESLKLVDFW